MPENRLPGSFFESRDTITLARDLLGYELVHDSPEGITSGIIVETEAYLCNDPACHAFNKRTIRTEPMYGKPGTIYVYLIYGMYQCVNVVSNSEGIGEAVLIRALEPTGGIDLMEMRRSQKRKKTGTITSQLPRKVLCNGPGKLVQAMGIERSLHNNKSLVTSNLYIRSQIFSSFETGISKRIGINSGIDLPYRFFIQGNPFVSR
jgi:DNA-3-methyladenine glycosylase